MAYSYKVCEWHPDPGLSARLNILKGVRVANGSVPIEETSGGLKGERAMKVMPRTLCAMALLIVLGFMSSREASGQTLAYETAIAGYYLGSGNDMVVDTDGNAYVIASYCQDQQHLDILIFKLDPEGSVVWTLPIVGDPYEHDYAEDITLDSSENVWITGWTASGSVYFYRIEWKGQSDTRRLVLLR